MNLLMKRAVRVRNGGRVFCHDQCDRKMAPRGIKRLRRKFKRAERNAWKKEAGTP